MSDRENGSQPQKMKTVNDLDEESKKVVMASVEAKERAYCPYSKFRVGAAVLTKSGQIFKGCNVENAAYPLCVCAERVAINSAVINGYREFSTIAICCDVVGSFEGPCGACRQCIVEFGRDWKIILVKPDLTIQITSIEVLLPMSFGPTDLAEERITY